MSRRPPPPLPRWPRAPPARVPARAPARAPASAPAPEPEPEPQPDTASDTGSVDVNRGHWNDQMQFLMSCISMSVGLGNVWRFPYAAYMNGGGAFLIPYLVILILVGRPMYYLEMIMGQFSSRSCVKMYDFCPGMRGVGGGQAVAVTCVMTYYSSLMAIITYYMFASFSAVLPWTVCEPSWDNCVNMSSSDLYFNVKVLREPEDINSGIGNPEWRLLLCLLLTWLIIYVLLVRGVKSAGKFSYFLALFPYVIMIVLLVKAATLPGAAEGILFFVKPDFKRILSPEVWYAAVAQCFFSLTVSFGNVIMYASYNDFKHNIYRDAWIVTILDTFTSLIAGLTIFGILGNLSASVGLPVDKVVTGGTDLAFISYPLAISKMESAPQLFSFLFFFMLFVLGLGSISGMASCIASAMKDRFHKVPHWAIATFVSCLGFLCGVVYITPGGQFILTLVDHHGASFLVYFLGIGELITISWIYGIRNICDDVEFMLSRKVGVFWRLCWVLFTPLILMTIIIYCFTQLKPILYKEKEYPTIALVCGWILTGLGLMQIPLYAVLAVCRRKHIKGLRNKIKAIFVPREDWGPVEADIRKEWLEFRKVKQRERESRVGLSRPRKCFNALLGY